MQWFREKFGAVVVSVVIGLIALVFIFYGIYSPRNTRGLSEGSVAGTVNGESISLKEYQQSLNQRLEFFRNMAGGKISDEQLRAFRVQESVFRDLAQRKLMIQEAKRLGIGASDEAVKEAVLEIPAFKKDGKFDLMTYKQVLESNGYSPGTFEHVVRDDLSAQSWSEFFKRRALVSDDEAKMNYLVTHDKRDLKYVVLTSQNGSKGLSVSDDEIKKFLSDPAKQNLAKAQYDARKASEFKGKSFDDVKSTIAHDVIASGKIPEAQKVVEKLAEEIVPLLTADKKSDARVDAILKPYGAQVRTTGMFNRLNQFVPGVGEAKDLVNDAFADKSPIDASQGGHAKKYETQAARVVAIVINSEKPDLAKFEAEREDVVRQIALKKEHDLFDGWMKDLMKKAKIDMNPDVVKVADTSDEG